MMRLKLKNKFVDLIPGFLCFSSYFLKQILVEKLLNLGFIPCWYIRQKGMKMCQNSLQVLYDNN